MPLRYYLQAVRGIMLRGTDAQQLQLPLIGLAVFAAVTLTLASLRFRKTL